jgi:hypothetical protein
MKARSERDRQDPVNVDPSRPSRLRAQSDMGSAMAWVLCRALAQDKVGVSGHGGNWSSTRWRQSAFRDVIIENVSGCVIAAGDNIAVKLLFSRSTGRIGGDVHPGFTPGPVREQRLQPNQGPATQLEHLQIVAIR